jgi:hypothetical protein
MKKNLLLYSLIVAVATIAVATGIFILQHDSANKGNLATTFPQKDQSGNPLSGTFEAVTPCDKAPKPLPQIPENAPCDHAVWKLGLYQNPDTHEPTTFAISARYGLSQPQTPKGHSNGGTMVETNGMWSVTFGIPGKKDAEIYRLKTEKGTISFIKVSDNLLHLLDQNDRLRVGNGGWSYTFSRSGDLLPLSGSFIAYESEPVKGSVYGVFIGRTPCAELVRQLHMTMPTDCSRIKWKITLYQDRNTLMPTTYAIRRVDVPDDTPRKLEGNWNVSQDALGTTVLQLDLKEYKTTLSFAKADNNILFFLDEEMNVRVGSDSLGYTLNREL